MSAETATGSPQVGSRPVAKYDKHNDSILPPIRAVAEVDFTGKVRATDPDTSWDAAKRQTNSRTNRLKAEIVVLLSVAGPMNDGEIQKFREQVRFDNHGRSTNWAHATAQSVRSRRASLVAEGKVRPLMGETPPLRPDGTRAETPVVKRPSENGNPSTVWEIVPGQGVVTS